ncbi:efflux RND transporter periplasmic adaptor subunit [Variovorax sp. RCC_210]|uniref:efflux RND transporter periplasmic adaptor subunit n=1 Tax=Variovorax sp. RCC_210 TaxID=3239217 RepID=UPI0035232EEB
MKPNRISFQAKAVASVAATLLLMAGAVMVFRAGASAKPAAAAPAQDVVATIASVVPVRTRVPLTVTAWGDVAPAQSESMSLPRAGQLVALPVVVGQRVRKGTVVARVAPDSASETGYATAQNAWRLAQGESQRTQALFKLQLATVSQVEAARKSEQDAQAALDALRKTGAGAGEAAVAAPFDGVVTALNAALGDRLAANASILQLGRVDTLRVNLGIEPARRAAVHLGDVVSLTALPSQGSSSGNSNGNATLPAGSSNATLPAAVQGHVSSLQDLVDAKTQLVNAVVQVPAASAGALVLGMRVQAGISTGSVDGWLVPRLAVLNDSQGDYVFQVRDGTAHRVGVQPRAEVHGQVAVDGAIDAALPVVSLGNYELQEGMKVREGAK